MSIYDRLHQRRQTAEAAPREAQPPPSPEPAPSSPLILAERQHSIQFAGLHLALPGERTRASETLIERDGGIATLRIARLSVANNATLAQAFAAALERLERKHAVLQTIWRNERQLGGHAALALDVRIEAGSQPRHARLVGAIVPTDGQGRQWLEITTLFDPTHAAFADWLIDFDAILDAVAAIPAPTT